MRINIREKFTAAVFVFLCFLLQSSVFPLFSLQRAVPDMILLCVCIYGWLRGEHSAMFCGFFGGLFIDIFFMDVLGVYALIYVFAGFLCGQLHRFFDEHEHRIPLFLIAIADLGVLLLRFLLFDVLYGNFRFGQYFVSRCLPEIVMTFLAGIVLYPVMLWVEMHFVHYERKKKDMNDRDHGNLSENSGSEGIV
ncbi:MAG: rod shape-determining protein MreD [Lachnospiraceae bacterium]|nr:rod shape-determining protein MreD [Lachnospiraceae bacterium]